MNVCASIAQPVCLRVCLLCSNLPSLTLPLSFPRKQVHRLRSSRVLRSCRRPPLLPLSLACEISLLRSPLLPFHRRIRMAITLPSNHLPHLLTLCRRRRASSERRQRRRSRSRQRQRERETEEAREASKADQQKGHLADSLPSSLAGSSCAEEQILRVE